MEEKQTCSNCNLIIEKSKLFLHEPFCIRNIVTCKICDEPIKSSELEEHYEFHRKNSEIKYRDKLLDHNNNYITQDENVQNITQNPCCIFCELQLNPDEAENHQRICGSRTVQCNNCRDLIIMREYEAHTLKCDGQKRKSTLKTIPFIENNNELMLQMQMDYDHNFSKHLQSIEDDAFYKKIEKLDENIALKLKNQYEEELRHFKSQERKLIQKLEKENIIILKEEKIKNDELIKRYENEHKEYLRKAKLDDEKLAKKFYNEELEAIKIKDNELITKLSEEYSLQKQLQMIKEEKLIKQIALENKNIQKEIDEKSKLIISQIEEENRREIIDQEKKNDEFLILMHKKEKSNYLKDKLNDNSFINLHQKNNNKINYKRKFKTEKENSKQSKMVESRTNENESNNKLIPSFVSQKYKSNNTNNKGIRTNIKINGSRKDIKKNHLHLLSTEMEKGKPSNKIPFNLGSKKKRTDQNLNKDEEIAIQLQLQFEEELANEFEDYNKI